MLSKRILSLIETLIEQIEEVENLIGGFYYTDPLVIREKRLIRYLNEPQSYYDEVVINTLEDISKEIQQKINNYYSKDNDLNKKNIKLVQTKTDTNGGWITIVNPKDKNITIKVAKIPFLLWAIGDTPYEHGKEKGDFLYSIKEKLIKKWGDTISFSGEKLKNDDVYHNEWIRSLGIDPKDFYELVKEDKSWIKDLSISYQLDYRDYLFDNMNNRENFDNNFTFIDNVDSSILNNKYGRMLGMYYKRLNKNNEKKELFSIPFSINEKTQFPLFISPIKYNEGAEEKNIRATKAVIVDNSDETVVETALILSDYGNSVLFTRNATETAHLINVAKDIKLNVFHLPKEMDIDYNKVYQLNKDGSIEEISETGYSTIGIPLQSCDNNQNWYKKEITPKVSNLAKLYNNNMNVLPGVYYIGKVYPKINRNDIIARSAGDNEGSNKATFSGMFKSILLSNKTLDNNKQNISDVINSFYTPIVKKYSEKMNVSLPKPGIFYQKYEEANQSFVIKVNKNEIKLESIKGKSSQIVDGNSIVDKKILKRKNKNVKYKKIIDLINNIENILNFEKMEIELIEKNKILYIIQVIELNN